MRHKAYAHIYPKGPSGPAVGEPAQIDIPPDLPPEYIGEVVVEALRNRPENTDPFTQPFSVVITFVRFTTEPAAKPRRRKSRPEGIKAWRERMRKAAKNL